MLQKVSCTFKTKQFELGLCKVFRIKPEAIGPVDTTLNTE